MSDAPPLHGVVSLPDWLGDVKVERGAVPEAPPGATARGVLWAAGVRRLWLEVPGVARYLAAEGTTLTVESFPAADPQAVARFARSTPLAALLYQRGLEVWHAAAAVRDGRAVVVAGDSGAGKSTLVAGLLARGWQLLADDLACVGIGSGGEVTVLGAANEVRLWPDAREQLGDTFPRAPAVPEGADGKQSGAAWLAAGHPLASCGPVPVSSIWRLRLDFDPAIEIVAEEGFRCFDAVGELAFHGRIAHALLDRAVHLRIAAGVASSVPLWQVRRPRGRWTVAELAEAIEQEARG